MQSEEKRLFNIYSALTALGLLDLILDYYWRYFGYFSLQDGELLAYWSDLVNKNTAFGISKDFQGFLDAFHDFPVTNHRFCCCKVGNKDIDIKTS